MPSPDPHADEWKRAVANGSYRDRRGTITAVAAVLAAVVTMLLWVYVFHDERYVYAHTGQDASWEVLKRGIMLSGFVGIAVAVVLTRVLGVRENAYTKGLNAFLKR